MSKGESLGGFNLGDEESGNRESFSLGGKFINFTKIKYIKVLNKVYKVKDISFTDMTIKAVETEISIADDYDDEIFNVMELDEFRITLVNGGGQAEIINFGLWKSEHDSKGEV